MKLARTEVVEWLNKRLSTFRVIDQIDMAFIIKVVDNYNPNSKVTLSDVQNLIRAVGSSQFTILLDNMTNKLINDYDIKIILDHNMMSNFMGTNFETIKSYK